MGTFPPLLTASDKRETSLNWSHLSILSYSLKGYFHIFNVCFIPIIEAHLIVFACMFRTYQDNGQSLLLATWNTLYAMQFQSNKVHFLDYFVVKTVPY